MIIKKMSQRLLVACMVFMLALTSVGGTYAAGAYANPVAEDSTDTADQGIKDASKGKEVLGGLLLIGLVAMAGKHGSSNKSGGSSSEKNYIESDKAKSGSANQSGSGSTVKSSMTAEEQQLVSLINGERSKQGLAVLQANNAVANVARAHSQDMINNNYFDHYDLKGGSPFTRLNQAGISYAAAGENIAINVSVPNAHAAFMNSAGHRANVLSKDYKQVGVGIVHSGSRIWVTENFIG